MSCGRPADGARSMAGLLAIFLALLDPSCAPVPSASVPAHLTTLKAVGITILHTSNIHGKFHAEGTPPRGGFANLSALVESERAAGRRVLLLDGGDLMTGHPICEYEYRGVKGGALIEMMNQVGYDAMALGHHEFDLGPRNLDGLLGLADFPILSANTMKRDGTLRTRRAYCLVEFDSLRVGVIGLTTEDLPDLVAPTSLAGTQVTPATEAVRTIVEEIEPQCDLIVVLSHLGVDADRRLARQVQGIDVIIGGHSETALPEWTLENGVILAQAGAHLQQVGRLRVQVQAGRVIASDGQLLALESRSGGRPRVRRMVSEYEKRIQRAYGRTLGRLARPWQRQRSAESNVGNWVCDRLREYGHADFALYNSGGILKDLAAGPVTRLDIFEMFPFENLVSTFECTGEELLKIMETNAQASFTNEHSILQVSGIRYSYTRQGHEVKILRPTVGGSLLDPRATYVGISVDYIVYSKARRYLGFEPEQRKVLGSMLSDVIVRAIEESRGPIDARLDQRIRKSRSS